MEMGEDAGAPDIQENRGSKKNGHCQSQTARKYRRIYPLPVAAGRFAACSAIQSRGDLLDADRPPQGHRRRAETHLPALVPRSGQPAPTGGQRGKRTSRTHAAPDSGPARPAPPIDEAARRRTLPPHLRAARTRIAAPARRDRESRHERHRTLFPRPLRRHALPHQGRG